MIYFELVNSIDSEKKSNRRNIYSKRAKFATNWVFSVSLNRSIAVEVFN